MLIFDTLTSLFVLDNQCAHLAVEDSCCSDCRLLYTMFLTKLLRKKGRINSSNCKFRQLLIIFATIPIGQILDLNLNVVF